MGVGFGTLTAASLVAVAMGLPAPPRQVAGLSQGEVAIPDIVVGQSALSIAIAEHGELLAARVSLHITHTWQGDLSCSLRHDGVTQRLFGRPGTDMLPGGLFGFSADDFGDAAAASWFTLDDTAPQTYDVPQVARPGISQVSGAWRPEEAFAMFGGQDCAGVWELLIDDSAGGDVGVARRFEVTLWVLGCPGDFDLSGDAEVADIFAFLQAWFTGAPEADYGGATGNDVPDIFLFLTEWFEGCE